MAMDLLRAKSPIPPCRQAWASKLPDVFGLENRQRLGIGKKNIFVDISGQIIIIFHPPRFPWDKGISLTEPPFGVRLCEVAIIWPDIWPGHSAGDLLRDGENKWPFWRLLVTSIFGKKMVTDWITWDIDITYTQMIHVWHIYLHLFTIGIT